MTIVVIGGTGLIGSKTVAILRRGGHDVFAASPNTGVNTITGEGLQEAMAGTQVVIDLSTRRHLKARRCWNSLKPPAAIFSRLRARLGLGTMSRFLLSARTGRPTTDTFAQRSPRRTSSRLPASPTPSSARLSSLSSSAASPRQVQMAARSGYRPACSSPSQLMTWLPSPQTGDRAATKRYGRDRLELLIDLGWIQTFGADSTMIVEVSVASEGGSDTSVQISRLTLTILTRF